MKNYDPKKIFVMEKKLIALSDAFYQICCSFIALVDEQADNLYIDENKMSIEMARTYVEEYERDHK